MRSARVELRVMRTMFGLPAAAGNAFATMRARKSAGKIRRNMGSSLPQRLEERTHAGESPAATRPACIDYHGGEDHSLPCAFYESGTLVSFCWCA